MNIKSLLLGSAAALVAVSGARAADAVVIAEPEPMEYVRICDTYGVGFYYIPGTETCLKLSGYIRYDIGIGSLGFEDSIDKDDFLNDVSDGYLDGDVDTNDTYYKRARFAFRADARQETELGTLRGFAQVNFNYDVNSTGSFDGVYSDNSGFTYAQDEGVNLNHAYIELGGFRIGKTDSLFTTFTGYASGVSNDGLVPYGPFDTHQIAYTFTGGNGFTAAIALEEGGGNDSETIIPSPGPSQADIYALDSYVPHVVGGIGWTGGWGGVSLVAGYDAVFEEGAIKGRVDFNVNDAISLFVMAGYGTNDDDIYDDFGGVDIDDSPNYYAPWGGQWAAWVGGAWKFTEKATFNFEVGYDDFEEFSVAANVDYELVPNFHIIPEVVYFDNGNDFGFDDAGNLVETEGDDEWGGFVRFQYNWGG
jgi:opacity protein-like surface antigen